MFVSLQVYFTPGLVFYIDACSKCIRKYNGELGTGWQPLHGFRRCFKCPLPGTRVQSRHSASQCTLFLPCFICVSTCVSQSVSSGLTAQLELKSIQISWHSYKCSLRNRIQVLPWFGACLACCEDCERCSALGHGKGGICWQQRASLLCSHGLDAFVPDRT